MRKAAVDLATAIFYLLPLVAIFASMWFMVESVRAIIAEVGQKVILVQPYYDVAKKSCSCQVAVVRQTG